MKNRSLRSHVLPALVLAAAALPALAQQPAAKPAEAPKAAEAAKPAAPGSGPKLVIAEEKKDVGTVAKGETIHHSFVVKNTGKADLHITDVKPSCGCTVPEYDKVIKPGAEGKITLSIDTKAFQGPISKSALILSDDTATPQVTVFVTANVKPYVETLPTGFFRLQALVGEAASAELVLVSDEADFKPGKVEVPQSYLKAALAPVAEKDRIAGKGPNQWKVTVTTAPDTPEGLLGGYVKVATGVAKQPELQLAISGYVKPTLSVTPLQVNFGNFDPKGDPVKRTVTIVNNNLKNETFKVEKADVSVAGIKAEIVMADKQRAQVVLSVDEKIKKGVFEGSLSVKTNDTAKGEIRIPLKGTIL